MRRGEDRLGHRVTVYFSKKHYCFIMYMLQLIWITRSLEALRAPTSRLRPFGPAFGLLDNVLHALRALRPCDPCISAMMG